MQWRLKISGGCWSEYKTVIWKISLPRPDRKFDSFLYSAKKCSKNVS